MLNQQGFNLWANHYDETVQLSEESNHYPFAGYKQILNLIFNEVMQKEGTHVLDIGFGTAVLTSQLYENGHKIDGIDFSTEMISIAQAKMPDAALIEWDVANGLPPEVLDKKYDFIVSTYALHHLTDEEKIPFLLRLLPLLKEGGKILIGDIAFETRERLEQCRKDSIDYWDDDEFYFVMEDLLPLLLARCTAKYEQISHCGGLISLSK